MAKVITAPRDSLPLDYEVEPYMHELLRAAEERLENGKRKMAVDPHQLDEKLRAAAEGVDADKEKRAKKKAKLDMSSGPPSPPECETSKRLTIAPCPARLTPYSPPDNYGAVETHKIYRSSFPRDRNMTFCRSLNIRTVLTLVDLDDCDDSYLRWVRGGNIKHTLLEIGKNKDGKMNTTTDSLCEAVLYAMDSSNHPLYIHCNQGKHRTGCVVACLRKVQRVPLDEIIAEYETYARGKDRDGDKGVIRAFDPNSVYEYAVKHDRARGLISRYSRNNSLISDIDSLAEAMAAGPGAPATRPVSEAGDDTMTISPDMEKMSLESDDGLEITMISAASVQAQTSSSTVSVWDEAQNSLNDRQMLDQELLRLTAETPDNTSSDTDSSMSLDDKHDTQA